MFKINDRVMFRNMIGKITAVLSDERYQVYTDRGEIYLAFEKELIKL